MNDIFAKVPESKPSNAAVFQLKPVELNGNNYYGWKMVFYKQVPSGNKTKDGRIKYKPVVDSSKPVVYDTTTQQMKRNTQSNSVLLSLVNGLAEQKLATKQQNLVLIKLMNQVAKLSMGGNK